VHTTLRLLYAGRLEQQQKRALDLVPFAKHLAEKRVNFRLDICGAGPEEDRIRTDLQEFLLDGRVAMHGWVTQSELYNRFYPQADCFIHFAAWEGVTISPREAMAHGVVPVISEFTGLHAERQFLDEVNSLTFPVGRPDAAAQRVVHLVSTPSLMAQLSIAAMESQSGRYSFAGAIDAWRDAFDKCMTLPPKTAPVPLVPEQFDGRLSRWGVPSSVQLKIRRWLNKPVSHDSPGSEWPTASGLMTPDERQEIEAFGECFEADQKPAPDPPAEHSLDHGFHGTR
jgi:hypothetical protein